MDPAPGASYPEKVEAYERYHQEYEKNSHKVAKDEVNIYKDMVYDGKTSHTGGFHATLTISQIDDSLPSHGGDKYVPTLMVVGTGDPMVYVGYEELFHNYYGQLSNVEAHFLDKLPLIQNKNRVEIVGHLLSNYASDKSPVNFLLGREFIERNIGQKLTNPPAVNTNPVVEVLKLYSTDFSFRKYVDTDFFLKSDSTQEYVEMKQSIVSNIQELHAFIRTLHPQKHLLRQLSLWLERLKQKQQGQIDEKFDTRI